MTDTTYTVQFENEVLNVNLSLLTGAPQALGDLLDVDLTGLQDGQLLVYDATQDKWLPKTASKTGDMLTSVYDINSNGIVDDSEKLNGQSGSYYLDRANHIGTQPASTISDFDSAVSTNTDVSANTSHRNNTDNPHLTGLNNLTDTNISSPSSGQALIYDGSVWVNQDIATQVELDTHINDTSIHYTQNEINITSSQISDFDSAVSSNSDVSANTSARHTHSNKTQLDVIDQNLDTTSQPTFAQITVNNLPTAFDEVATKEYVDISASSLGLRFYLTDTDSGVEDYKETSITDPNGTEASFTKSGLNDGDYVLGFISPLEDTPTKLLSGTYTVYVEAEKTSGTQDLQLYWELVERKSDDSEVVIATSTASEVIESRTGLIISLYLPTHYELSTGSRIIGKLRAQVSGTGNAPTVVIYYQGSTGANWSLPANSEILMNLYVPYNGATKDIDLGSNNLSTTGTISTTDLNINGNNFDTAVSLNSDVSANTNHRNDTTIHFTQNEITITTSQISDWDNQFTTDFDTNFNNKTTDNLAEGTTNKYDKEVTFTGGTNITIDGTYPNFIITDNSVSITDFNNHIGDTSIHYTQEEISITASQVSDFDTEVSNNTDVSANTAHRSNMNNPHNTSVSNLSDVSLSSPISGDALVYDGNNWVNQALSVSDSQYTILKIYTPTSLTAHSEGNALATATESFTINKDLSEYTSLFLIFLPEYLITRSSFGYNAYGRFTLGFQEIGGSGYAYDLTNTQTFWMFAYDAYNKLRYNYIYTHIHQLTSAEKSNGIDIEVTIDAYGGGGSGSSTHDFTHTCRHIIVIGIK